MPTTAASDKRFFCFQNGAPKVLPLLVCHKLLWESQIGYVVPTGFLRSSTYAVPQYVHGLATRAVMKMWYELMRRRAPITEDDLDTTRGGLIRCAKRVRDMLFAGIPIHEQPIETVYTPVKGGEVISAYQMRYGVSRLMIVSVAADRDVTGSRMSPWAGGGESIDFDWTLFEVPPDDLEQTPDTSGLHAT